MVKQNLGRVAMVSKGEYSSATNYERLDIVTYQGSSYVCKKDSIGNLPTNTEYFDILAEKGTKGEDGQDGYTPEKGKDYYTEADKNEIEADVTNMVSSMIPDVSNFITATVSNLVNYYLKTDVYNKDEINALISTSKTGIFEVVSELPTPSLQTLNTIYLVPSNNPRTQNVKDEYLTIPINDGYEWENIGSTSIDLSGYATETWVNRQISDFLTDTEIQQLINTAVNAKYTKPLTGIPKTDLVSTVQTSLDKADNALPASRMVTLTQAQYDALETKDSDTYYHIPEEE